MKEDDLDVVLSPQRRSFGGGCHVTAAVSSRRSGSPLEKDGDGLRLLGGRRIGSGSIISARTFEKDHRLSEKDLRDSRDRDRERDYKDKRFRVCLPDPLAPRVCAAFFPVHSVMPGEHGPFLVQREEPRAGVGSSFIALPSIAELIKTWTEVEMP